LFASDGCLSSDGRHIDFTSKDRDQIVTFQKCLGLQALKVGTKSAGVARTQTYFRLQFSDVIFWNWLNDLGLTPNKSKTLSEIAVPPKYFFDFLRGVFDGDGSFYSYQDRRWKSSFMFYLSFASASPDFIEWLRDTISNALGVTGSVSQGRRARVIQLKYAKADSLKILKKVYYSPTVPCLARKRDKICRVVQVANLTI
jgi:hypothetical protein